MNEKIYIYARTVPYRNHAKPKAGLVQDAGEVVADTGRHAPVTTKTSPSWLGQVLLP